MSAIGPGMQVECIKEFVGPIYSGSLPVVGGVYEVVWAGEMLCHAIGKRIPAIKLSKISWFGASGIEGAYAAENFRPAGRKDESLIRELLKPTERVWRALND